MAQANVEIKDLGRTQKTYHYSARNYGEFWGNRMQDSGMGGRRTGQNDLRWYTGEAEFVGRVGGGYRHP